MADDRPEKLGGYLVEGELGRGGMGVVYLARDPMLDRLVAVKVLPEELGANTDRLGRFLREARTLAGLNHPNIAAVYGLHADAGRQLLVMEYVPGRHLGERLRGEDAPTLHEALGIGRQIAAGLEAAHESGVIHRDVKPANIRVRPDGAVKVLDFGLAKLDEPEPTIDNDDATRTFANTEAGRVLGTAGYMSPEQARGKPVDKRADVWAFGAVLFECLAGTRAFPGDTPMDAIVAILEKQPPWERLPASTPPRVGELLRRCLEKDLARRLKDMGDARMELEDAIAALGHPTRPPQHHAHPYLSAAPTRGHGLTSLSGSTGGFSNLASIQPGSSAARLAGTPNSASSLASASNLPGSLQGFVGRARELREIEAILPRTRLLCLAGTGGCGKSRLAVESAKRMSEAFDAGAWWVDLASIKDPSLLIPQIAGTLGAATSDAFDPADSLAEAIHERPILIVLDNCEQMLAEAARACTLLLAVCPGMRIIATTREPLGVPGEAVYRVPPLPVPPEDATDPAEIEAFDSVRLFVDRARAVRPNFDLADHGPAVVARICRRLDGIPLAVELAAARVKMLTCEQIDERLDDRFQLLGPGRRRGGGRQRTLEDAISWSFDQLEPDERAVFRRLCVFCGGFTLSGAERLAPGPVGDGGADLEAFEVLDVLSQLIDKSMIAVDEDTRPQQGAAAEPRYAMLETVRQYGLRRLEEVGELDEARRRHLEWAADLACRAEAQLQGRHESGWMARLTLEHANIRAALYFAASRGADADLARRIGAGVWRFWLRDGHIAEGRRQLLDLERRAAGAEPTAAWARVRAGIAWLALAVADLPSAIMFGRAAVETARVAGDRPTRAAALAALGAACHGEGLADRAIDHLEDALTIYEGLGLPAAVADTQARLADCLRVLGRTAEAAAPLEAALALAEPEGPTQALAYVLSRRAWLSLQTGDLPAARHDARRALSTFHAVGSRTDLPEALELLAAVATTEGVHERAAELLGAAAAARKRLVLLPRPAGQADLALSLDRLRARLGDADFDAARARGAALKITRAVRYALDDETAPLATAP